jgi:hypothetical protein
MVLRLYIDFDERRDAVFLHQRDTYDNVLQIASYGGAL